MRGRREERRDERQDDRQLGRPGGGGNHYQMRQKMVAIGDDFWIENERGQKVFKVDGKALRVRQTLVFEDAHGKELCKIQERMLRIKDSMEIEGPRGRADGHGQESHDHPTPRALGGQDQGRSRPGGARKHPGSRIHHRRRARQGGGGVQEVVPPARYLRRVDRSGPGRCPDPGGGSVHRRDGARRTVNYEPCGSDLPP